MISFLRCENLVTDHFSQPPQQLWSCPGLFPSCRTHPNSSHAWKRLGSKLGKLRVLEGAGGIHPEPEGCPAWNSHLVVCKGLFKITVAPEEAKVVNAIVIIIVKRGIVLGKHSEKNMTKTSVGARINMKELVQVLQRDSCTGSPWGARRAGGAFSRSFEKLSSLDALTEVKPL